MGDFRHQRKTEIQKYFPSRKNKIWPEFRGSLATLQRTKQNFTTQLLTSNRQNLITNQKTKEANSKASTFGRSTTSKKIIDLKMNLLALALPKSARTRSRSSTRAELRSTIRFLATLPEEKRTALSQTQTIHKKTFAARKVLPQNKNLKNNQDRSNILTKPRLPRTIRSLSRKGGVRISLFCRNKVQSRKQNLPITN